MQLDRAGEAPHTAVIGCADMRAPVDTVFDALPGDLFVLRNVGNTCSSAECSMIGSLEFCVNAINTRNIMVIGHKHCGAIKKATQALLHPHQQEEQAGWTDLQPHISGFKTHLRNWFMPSHTGL